MEEGRRVTELHRTRFEQLVERVQKHLNWPSFWDVITAGRQRWLNVGKTVFRGLGFTYGEEKGVKSEAENTWRVANRSGVDVEKPLVFEMHGLRCYVIASKLPNLENAFLAYRPHRSRISDHNNLKGFVDGFPKDGNYLVVHTPTVGYDYESLAPIFNDGCLTVSDKGEIRKSPDISGHKGGVALKFTAGRRGEVRLMSPGEISLLRQDPNRYFPQGGVIIGTPLFFQISETRENLSEQVAEIMKANAYPENFNSEYGFLVRDRQGKFMFVTIVFDTSRLPAGNEYDEIIKKFELDRIEIPMTRHEHVDFKLFFSIFTLLDYLNEKKMFSSQVVSLEENWGAGIEGARRKWRGVDSKNLRHDGPDFLIPLNR